MNATWPTGGRMTDKEFVQKTWPGAKCFYTKLYWPGHEATERWVVTRSSSWSGVDGEGVSEEDAWKSAAKRVERKK